MTIHKNFIINTAGDLKPWGAREEQAIRDIIDTLVSDTVGGVRRVSGHLHPRMYDLNGARVFDTGKSLIYIVAERDVLSHGNNGYSSNGDLVRFCAVDGEQAESQAGMLLEYGYGLRLSVFASQGAGKMGGGIAAGNTYDVVRIHERDGTFSGGEIGIMVEPVPGVAMKVGGALQVADKAMITPEGGFAVKVIVGEAIAAGEICYTDPGQTSGRVYRNPTTYGAMPQGVAYAAAANAGDDLWLVTGGIVAVLPHSAEQAYHGNWIFASTSQVGRVSQSSSVPTTLGELLLKVGRFLDDGVGVGTATRAIVHF